MLVYCFGAKLFYRASGIDRPRGMSRILLSQCGRSMLGAFELITAADASIFDDVDLLLHAGEPPAVSCGVVESMGRVKETLVEYRLRYASSCSVDVYTYFTMHMDASTASERGAEVVYLYGGWSITNVFIVGDPPRSKRRRVEASALSRTR